MKNIIFLFILIGALSVGATVRSGGGITSSGADTATGWTKSGANVYTTTSSDNVGIGTSKPIALFNINSSATQDLFRVDDNLGSDLTPFIIDQTGNVGIGTATPQAILSVSSTLNQTLFRVDDNGDGDKSPFIIDANGNVGIGTINTERDALLIMSGNVGVGTWVPSTKLDVAGTIVSIGLNVIGGNVGIGTTTPQGGLVVTNGNVGIGTWTAPDLVTIGAGGRIRLYDGTEANYGTIQGTSSGITIDAANSSTGAVTFTSSGTSLGVNSNLAGSPIYTGFNQTAGLNLVFRAATGNGIGFIPNGASGADFTTTAMYITSGKNVGIGTNVPSSLLEVGVQKFNVTTAGNIGIGTTLPQGALSVMSGNVGIGTFAPENQLVIGGTRPINFDSTGGSVRMKGSSSGWAMSYGATGNGNTDRGGFGIFGAGDAFTYYYIGAAFNSAAMYITSSNVGIGTTVPGQKLDIVGNTRVVTGVYGATQASAPTIATNDCGGLTQGTVNANSTDLAGTVTAGTAAGSVLTCAVTFGQSHTTAPASCVCQDQTTPLALAATYTSTKLTCTSLATVASAVLNYQCQWNTP